MGRHGRCVPSSVYQCALTSWWKRSMPDRDVYYFSLANRRSVCTQIPSLRVHSKPSKPISETSCKITRFSYHGTALLAIPRNRQLGRSITVYSMADESNDLWWEKQGPRQQRHTKIIKALLSLFLRCKGVQTYFKPHHLRTQREQWKLLGFFSAQCKVGWTTIMAFVRNLSIKPINKTRDPRTEGKLGTGLLNPHVSC